ncbi:PAS domain S-box-containing protein/diguanylate cyclase (GGDEF) domain-containing protein [Pseudomonas flavescens]|uniref:PAS domain S-box-containing protein/diguanylate cyclase (GGDEF) domain-containing protein n=1 Tax=Phytopseudomonas flavescens TaxID=29435 RepID=A0A1G8KNR3_9GAMM|nr:diguanylate cyclase [Pseudomonas flavescens]SDI45074.1 PAS domain S-box-containing protein/diguanylate cyclase (GGDEF) domain-containing protein [Pseudomonas flavescens]
MQDQDETLGILVVDDRWENLEDMQELLEEVGRPVHCVDSGAKALEYMQHAHLGLVLLDVQMPRMDGFEVARRMRAEPRTRFTPIIFISGISQTDDVLSKGYGAGAVDFISKPVQPAILLHKVRALLEHEQYRSGLLRLSQQLERERAFNASILENTAEGILVVGDDGRIRFANPAIARMLGCHGDELAGSELLAWIDTPREDHWQTSSFHQYWLRREHLRLHDANLRSRDGSDVPVALSCSPLPDDQNAMIVLALDMSLVRDLHRQLESLAITDALTGLLNRRGFLRELQASISRNERTGQQAALLYLDLDGFKHINDTLGHETGDQVLRRVSEQLKACLRPYDRLARIGGDEFTVILDSLGGPADAASVAEKLVLQVSGEQPEVSQGVQLALGVSIGIACIPADGNSVEDVLRAADTAMYAAKRGGRRQFRFYADGGDSVSRGPA